MDEGNEDQEEFDVILPSLITQLKNILKQYPDNGQIIKEIVQNAEDAGASVVKFLYDENEEETLFSQGIEELKGAALYSFNDAQFTDEDWKGIRMLGKSIKEKDPIKVGKFGLGFKSVFHMTDNAVIMSGKKLGIINPNEQLFSNNNARRTGKFWNFEHNPQATSCHRDVIDVLKNVLNTYPTEGRCNGTVFRFTFRKEASNLSESIYNEEKVKDLFEIFKSEGHLALMFLKNLAKIEFYKRTKGSNSAQLLFSFAVNQGISQNPRTKEKQFMKDVTQAHICNSSRTLHLVTNVIIDSFANDDVIATAKRATYEIIHFYGGEILETEEEFASKERAKESGFIPLVGLAYQVSEEKSTDGHIYCALPLPIIEEKATGLPVHVNGYFALGPDRKDLKWLPTEQTTSNDREVSWNMFLLQKVLPAAYKEMFLHLKKSHFSAKVVYNALPDISEVDSKWKKFAVRVLFAVFHEECVWSDAVSKWMSLKDVYFLEKNRSGHEAAHAFLKLCSFPVACMTEHMMHGLKMCNFSVKNACPKVLQSALAQHSEKLDDLLSTDRIDILSYILQNPSDIRSLLGVPILPLEDGRFACPSSSTNESLFIATNEHSKELVPGCEKKLIKTDIEEDVLNIIIQIANKRLCQIKMLNERNVATLLKYVYQADTSQIVTSFNFPEQWFPLIWGHINKYSILKDFEGLPLIPLSADKSVAILEPKSLIIYHEDTDDVISLLKHMGFIVTRQLPNYILQNSSVFQCGYIHKYKDENLLDLLSNLISLTRKDEIVSRFCAFDNNKAKLDLIHKLSHSSSIRDLYDLLRSLPFCEGIVGDQLVSINQCELIAPRELPDVMPEKMLLKYKNEALSSFIKLLGGSQVSKRELSEDVLLPAIEHSISGECRMDHKQMIKYILGSIPADPDDRIEWQNVIKRISNTRFVRSDDEMLYKPIELFHRQEILLDLFRHEKGRFPFHDQNLEVLELKTEFSVSANDIMRCIDTVTVIKDTQQAIEKSKFILEFLESHSELLANHELMNKIKNTAWIPVQKARSNVYPKCLIWFGEKCDLASPVDMVFEKSSHLVGSMRPVFHKDFEHFAAITIAKQNSHLNHQDVINQLVHIVTNYNLRHKNECLIVLKDVYRHLEKNFRELTQSQEQFLHQKEWIWCEGGFVKPNQIVLDAFILDMRPYIYNLPQDIQESKDLLSKCGSITSVDKEKLIAVLHEVRNVHEHNKPNKDEVDRDRRICMEVLKVLSQMTLSEGDIERVVVPVRSEDGELLLKDSTEAVYCPIGGLSMEEEGDEEETDEMFFLHECMTEQVAIALQIRSLTSKLIGAEDIGIFEEYGQHEPLTRRINRILNDYGDGFAIIKELIQNADDAGATEVKLLYDERLNEDKRINLIYQGMSDFQGPALWAYNNAKFSKEDFDNIVKLGGATKKDKRDKIGKFGLGFNAVYNLTDVPSFISDNKLVILDPHTTNLGNMIKNKSKPGVKVSLGPSRNRLRRIKDQILIYDGVFGMDASVQNDYKPFDGTLFRFPLRTEQQARRSKIKNLFYNKEEMKRLLEKLAIEANRLLIFTQNVCSVELFHLGKDAEHAHDMVKMLHISKRIFRPDLDRGLLTSSTCPSFDIMSQSSSLVAKCKAADNQQQSMARNLHNIVDIITNIDGAAKDKFNLEMKCNKETWLIHSSIDDEVCMQMALEDARLNPIACAAACIRENITGTKIGENIQLISKTGYFYCFLPLPILNGFNIHINSTFALSKDRKSFQETSEDDKTFDTQATIWNRELMSGPVSLAYTGLLKDLTSIIQVKDEATWYSYWPQQDVSESKTHCYKRELIKSFYQNIISNKACIFPTPRPRNEWLDWSQLRTIADMRDRKNGEEIETMMEEVFGLFVEEKTIVHIPKQVLSIIEDLILELKCPTITLSFSDFFTEVFMPNVNNTQMTENTRNSILKFAIREFSSDNSVHKSLETNNCIPTQPSGRLKKPSDLVKPGSKAGDLFITDEEVFPLEEFKSCYEELLECGMMSDPYSWKVLISRAKTVSDLSASNLKAAQKRSKKILELIMEMKARTNAEPKIDWKSIGFLPVKSRPSNWQYLNWEGEKSSTKFAAAKDLYLSRFENIVGCHKLIIDDSLTGVLSNRVEKLLGINTRVTVSDIIKQVDMISACIKDRKESKLQTILPTMFHDIYQMLSNIIKYKSESWQEVVEGFRDKPVILTSDKTLVKAKQVAFDFKYLAQPYLYQLQPEFAIRYKDIMTTLQVKERFDMDDYYHALLAIKDDAKDNPISDSQLETVRNLLYSINEHGSLIAKPIFLPAEDKVLWPKETVIVKENFSMKNDASKRYLNEIIPPQLALSLGAKTERSHSISIQSRGLPFGQREKLTVRLKRILEAYPSQIQILYELLQNADDAGAHEVKFVLDKRRHDDKKVFSDAWTDLQGPSLLVFNDAPFTQQDIEGIQNLGEGSKSDDCEKTGQYGIGFNVVYHVTDAPCLLTEVESNSVLCIFDPHARYLEECSEAEPGRMFENARTYLNETFPDIYHTFLPDLLTKEESAILRLPLRTVAQADASLIKGKATTIEDITKMFQCFKDNGPEGIVFLRHVRSVELHVIDSHGPTKVFSLEAEMKGEDLKAMSLLNEDYLSLISNIRKVSESKRDFDAHKGEVSLKINGNRSSKWRIIQKCASVNPRDLPSSVNEQYEKGKLPLIPLGGIACNLDNEEVNGKVYCLLPLTVSSSLPIHINGKFILDYESRRRLWYTNDDSFQKVWNFYVIEHCIIPCYIKFISMLAEGKRFEIDDVNPYELLCRAFQEKEEHPKEINAYFNHFPKLRENETAHEYEADLIKMFYRKVTNEAAHVMPVLRPWKRSLKVEFYPPNSVINKFYIGDFFINENKYFQKVSSRICIALIKIGANIYNIPADIVRSFDNSGVPLTKLTPKAVKEILLGSADEILRNKDKLPLAESAYRNTKTVKALLSYCMKDEQFELKGIPLLVTEDNMLRRFNESKHVYFDESSILFPSTISLTLHPELREVLYKLKEINSGPLRKFMLADFSQKLGEELPPEFMASDEIEITRVSDLNTKLPAKHWLRKAWCFLRRLFEEEQKTEGKKEETAAEWLDQISNWCLFPVERRFKCENTFVLKRHFLIRINKAATAIISGEEFTHIVQELSLPVPSSSFVEQDTCISSMRTLFPSSFSFSFTKPNYTFLMKMATSTDNVGAFISALTSENEREQPGFLNLSQDAAKDLLKFFSRKVSRKDFLNLERLKSLPVWEDLSGTLKSLPSSIKVYLTSDTLPKDGMTYLQMNNNIILLKNHAMLTSIYRYIGLETQDENEVYKKFILQHFDELQQEHRQAHLHYLYIKFITSNSLEDGLLKVLKNTRIIEKNGELSFVRDFYDPDVHLFKVMLPKSEFPPQQYNECGWLRLLRSLGLISQTSPELFCDFATRTSSALDKKERKNKSHALINYLRESDSLQKDKIFIEKLSSINFLVADTLKEDLVQVYPRRNQEDMLCFSGAFTNDGNNTMLCWTVENILPSYASNSIFNPSLPLEGLAVKMAVPANVVARNLKNVSKSDLLTIVADGVRTYSTTYPDTFRDIYDMAYQYLNNREIDKDSVQLLSSIPVIHVNKDMICVARKVTLESGFDMPPYLFSMPIRLGRFAELFQKIGMTRKPTICQLVEVLNGLFFHTDGNPLEPNEAEKTLTVIERMTNIVQEEEFPHNIVLLYLPGVKGDENNVVSLYESNELVYFDDNHYEKRLNRLGKPRFYTNFMKLKTKHPNEMFVSQFIAKLPLNLRPKMLSSIVREEMIDSDEIGSFGFTKDLKTAISSIEFAECMMRLLKHQGVEHSHNDMKCKEETVELLSRIQVITTKTVRTVLALQSSGVRLEESECDKDVFVANQENMLKIYVSSSLTQQSDTIAAVSSALVSFYRAYFSDPSLAPHVTALLQKDRKEMHDYLDKQNIRRYFEAIEKLSGIFYSPGEFVPLDLHCLLINDTSNFDVDDYIAYEVDDPGIDGKEGGPVYIYAKILECITEGEFKDFYKIDIGMEEAKLVHKSELYGFYREDNLLEDGKEEHETLEDVKEYITNELEEAFKHGTQYANRVIKRLWLKWHPDKNLGMEEFCKEIFQFIQAEASRLQGDSNNTFLISEESFQRYQERGRDFYHMKRNFYRSSRRDYSWRNGSWRASNGMKNPQPWEARRWYRQAEFDLMAAKCNRTEGCYEWVCFKCHQAAEKFLRSAVYMQDANDYNHHFLRSIAAATANRVLQNFADEMESILIGSAALRYPNRWCYPDIPHDKYDSNKAERALHIAEEIHQEVGRIVNNA